MGFYSGLPLPMPDNVLTVMISNEPLFLSDLLITLPLNDNNLEDIKKLYENCKTETQKIVALNSYLNYMKYDLGVEEIPGLIETFDIEV